MPNRVIRDGFLDSEKVNRLDWFAECVYHRLLLAADDAGRIDGRTDAMVSRLFPLRGRVRASDVDESLHELHQAGLIRSWTSEGHQVVQVTNWRRCGRALYSRYPGPDGSYAIEYIDRETRDGNVSFVITSLADLPPPANPPPTPSVSHSDPIATPSASHTGRCPTKTGTKTGTKTKTGGSRAPPAAASSAAPRRLRRLRRLRRPPRCLPPKRAC